MPAAMARVVFHMMGSSLRFLSFRYRGELVWTSGSNSHRGGPLVPFLALLLPLGDADQLVELRLRQRGPDELERHRVRHHFVDTGDAIRTDRAQRQEFGKRAPRGRLRELGECRIGL